MFFSKGVVQSPSILLLLDVFCGFFNLRTKHCGPMFTDYNKGTVWFLQSWNSWEKSKVFYSFFGANSDDGKLWQCCVFFVVHASKTMLDLLDKKTMSRKSEFVDILSMNDVNEIWWNDGEYMQMLVVAFVFFQCSMTKEYHICTDSGMPFFAPDFRPLLPCIFVISQSNGKCRWVGHPSDDAGFLHHKEINACEAVSLFFHLWVLLWIYLFSIYSILHKHI